MMSSERSQGEQAISAAAALLEWYREMGVDAAVADDAIDWRLRGDTRPGADYTLPEVGTAQAASARSSSSPGSHAGVRPAGRPSLMAPPPVSSAAKPATPRPAPSLVAIAATPGARQFPTSAPDEATLAARAAAGAAVDLEDLGLRLAAFEGCALKATAKSLCFYRGAPVARLMVLGEAPGGDEDKVGKPFAGPIGALLDKMLAAIGMSEANVHMANAVYWRPPGNRPPTPQEVLVCRPFLERQIAFVQPDALLLLGSAAANHFFEVPEGLMKVRGKWRDVNLGGRTLKAMATIHPRELLRTPAHKRMAWRDLLMVEAALAEGKAEA